MKKCTERELHKGKVNVMVESKEGHTEGFLIQRKQVRRPKRYFYVREAV